MKKLTLFLALTFGSFTFLNAQDADIEKRMKKVNSFISKNKLEKASEKLSDLLIVHPRYGEGWDLQSKLKYKAWKNLESTSSIFDNLTVEVKGKDGEEPDEEALKNAETLKKMLQSVSPASRAKAAYLETLRSATMSSRTAYYSSILLRSEIEKIPADTNISEKGLEYFMAAEREFRAKNYEKAAEKYEMAVLEDRNFFKAQLYWGDAYYFMGDYLEAIEQFNKAKNRFPDILEPRKYLVDSYGREGLFQKAVDEGIESFTVYPDFSMMQKLSDAARLNDQEVLIEWTPRSVFPNMVDGDTNKILTKDSPWKFYQEAQKEVEEYCSEDGIIEKDNGVTKHQYLEVYSWERMLAQSNDASLDEARKMQEAGYLDCYVLVTCFHHDFYNQFKAFSKENKERIIKYYNEFIQ